MACMCVCEGNFIKWARASTIVRYLYIINYVCIASFCFVIFVFSNCTHFMDGPKIFDLEHNTDKQLRHTIILSNVNYLPSVPFEYTYHKG